MMEKLENITLAVEGIPCRSCAMDVENILLDLNGIDAVAVSFMTNTVTISYDPGMIEEKHIVFRIRKLGLKTQLINRP